MAASAERMNYVPFPQELKPFAFRASRYLDPTGVLITSYYVDGLPSERVVRAMRGAFPDKVIQTDNAYAMSPPSTVLPDISLSLWGKESCRVDFYRQLSAPEQLYEKAKGFFGL